MPERQSGVLVNGFFPMRDRVLWRGLGACGSGVCPVRTKRGSSGVGIKPRAPGHDSGGEKECGRTGSKSAPKRRGFVAFRPQLFMPEPRWARSGVAAVPAVSVCAVLSQRRRVRGPRSQVGPNYRAALLSSLSDWSFLRCTSWRNDAARV